MLGLPDAIRACLFDLDGVLTDTASVHKKAWKAMFDSYLRERSDRTGEPFVEFDPAGDYLTYIDGKKREDGVRSFLSARDITLPEGDPDDDASAECAIPGRGSGIGAGKRQTSCEESDPAANTLPSRSAATGPDDSPQRETALGALHVASAFGMSRGSCPGAPHVSAA